MTNIRGAEAYNTWQIENVGKSNLTEKLVADVQGFDPMGIKYWFPKTISCTENETFQTKITNVSLSSVTTLKLTRCNIYSKYFYKVDKFPFSLSFFSHFLFSHFLSLCKLNMHFIMLIE